MNNTWRWIIGIVVGLAVIGLLLTGRSERQAYRIARGAIEQRDQARQDRIDFAVETATQSVDLALTLAGDLPSQQAAADLIKQDIEEIGNRLKEASDARGDAAKEKLDQSIEQFNATLEAVEDASNKATDPKEKAVLDRIYGVLFATKQQITQAVLNRHQK
jgi:hypothetical protein